MSFFCSGPLDCVGTVTLLVLLHNWKDSAWLRQGGPQMEMSAQPNKASIDSEKAGCAEKARSHMLSMLIVLPGHKVGLTKTWDLSLFNSSSSTAGL